MPRRPPYRRPEDEALIETRESHDGRSVAWDQLANSPEQLRAVVDGALAAVVTMDEDGVITGWGARAEETFGCSAGEMVGRKLVEAIIPEQHRTAHNAGLARFRSTRSGQLPGRVMELSAP